MAQILPKHIYIILTIFLFSLLIEGESEKFAKSLSPKLLHLKKEKLTHLHFYWHDIFSGEHPTKVTVVKTVDNTTKTFFGAVSVLDDALRVGPGANSKIVGRAQGMYVASNQKNYSIVMAMSFEFTEGEYNGSTLSVLGSNLVALPKREVPIVGGSGLFRFSSGYAIIKTYKFIPTVFAIMEMDFYVLHYGDS
ncbi:dirigent protein 7-like [Rutidosis leptorrhynchoides]|uniref:dirigent protein 7-like n=1 Tax=Rutidosis leptorrhynchoides TaxID=125765 RepID=UPI003A98E088